MSSPPARPNRPRPLHLVLVVLVLTLPWGLPGAWLALTGDVEAAQAWAVVMTAVAGVLLAVAAVVTAVRRL